MEFEHRHKARGVLALVGILICAAFGLAALFLGDGGLKLFGVIFAAVAVAMAVSAWKKEEWHLRIASGVLTWSYPKSWAPATGSIALAEVASAEINEDLSIPAATFILKKGETTKLLLAGSGYALSQHLASHYPQLPLTYVPSKSSG